MRKSINESLALLGKAAHLNERTIRFFSGCYANDKYKQAGNAMTANVIHAIGLRLKATHGASVTATKAGKGVV